MTEQTKQTIEMLSDWIKIPSVNPFGAASDSPTFGEQAMAERIASDLEEIGCRVELHEVKPGRPNVLGFLECGNPEDPWIVLDAHTDTVDVPEGRDDLFQPQVKGTLVQGRGAADDKGPALSFLLAMKKIARERPSMKCNVLFAGVMGEEMDMEGVRALMKEDLNLAGAIVAEPTDLDVVVAHKGVIRWEIVAHGIAGHGAEPLAGRNAVTMASRFVAALENEYLPSLEKIQHPLLGRPTYNVGRIFGGRQYNIIPERCTIHLERRYLPNESHEEPGNAMRALIERVQRPGDEFEMHENIVLAPFEIDPHHPFVIPVLKSATAHRPRQRLKGVHWAADSGVYFQHGIPAVVFGPGSISEAHTDHEQIDVVEVEAAADIVADALMAMDPSDWQDLQQEK